MGFLVLDIETIGTSRIDVIEYISKTIKPPATYKLADSIAKWHKEQAPAAIDEAISKTGLDGAFGQVVVVGLAFNDYAPVALSTLNEPELLNALNYEINLIPMKDWITTCIVGFNVQAFDLRFLIQRFIVNNIKPHPVLLRAINAKGWEVEKVFDCMTQFAGFGNRISLDKTCLALGIESPKGEMDGSMVSQYVMDDRLDEVAAYCKRDVTATREIFKRITFAGQNK
jgi:hypothetical protein